MLKKNLKRLMALVTVFAMAIALISMPNASAKADEANGKITFANGYDWTLQADQIYAFASEDAETTVGAITGQGEGFMAWFHSVILEANEDGTYSVVATGFANATGAETATLGEGKVILMAHSTTVSNLDTYNWLYSLAVDTVVSMDITWADLAAAYGAVDVNVAVGDGLVPEEPVEEGCTHEGLVHMDEVEAGCHYNGNVEYWVCYDCEGVWADEALTQVTNIKNVVLPATGEGNLVHFDAVEPACHYAGNIEYWVCYDCEQVWQDEALTQLTNIKNVVLPELGGEVVHVEAVEPTATENGNIEFWYCEACEQVWQDEARTQLTNFKNVIVPATGEEEPEETVAATATFANGYDWTAQTNQIYIFASEDATASISSLTGQDEGTFAWFHTVVLEANEDGTYTVVAAGFGNETGAIAETLGEGKVIFMAHDTTSYVDSFNALKAFAVGDVVGMDTAWADVAAKYAEAVEIAVGFGVEAPENPVDPEDPADPENPADPEDPADPETPADKDEADKPADKPADKAPETGDSAPIVVYVVTLLVAAAAVVVALKKRFA